MEINDFVVDFANQFDETDASEITIKTAFKDLEEWSSLLELQTNLRQKVKLHY